MWLNYIVGTLPLLISFAMATGKLNENFYVKSFAFGLAFMAMLALRLPKERRIAVARTSVCMADVWILGVTMLFLYAYIGLQNVVDHSIPLMYFLFYCFVRCCPDIDFSRILLHVVPVVILIHLLLCVLQSFSLLPNYNQFFSIGSTFGNPDMLSAYLAVLLPFCYIGRQWKAVRWLLTLSVLLLFFLLQSRTAILASLLVLFCYFFLRYKGVLKKYIPVAVILFLLGLIGLACWHEASVLGRFYIWIVSQSMFMAKPWGWGAYAFEKFYPEYQAQFTIQHPEIVERLNYDIVHSPYNEFLYIAVTVGVLGLLFYVLFVFCILRMTCKAKSLLFFPLLTFQIISLSYFPFRIIPLGVFYMMCCAMAVNSCAPDASKLKASISSKMRKPLLYTMSSFVIVCCGCNAYSFFYWKKAIAQMGKKEYAQAEVSFERSFPWLQDNGRFLASFAELKYKTDNPDETLLLMEKAGCYFSDIPFLHNWAMLYEQKGKVDEAREKLDLAVAMSPRNIDIRLTQIQFLQRIGEVEEARRKALLLKNKIKDNNSRNSNQAILDFLNQLIEQS